MTSRDSFTALIRKACPDDAGQIAAVHVETWRTAYPLLLPESVLEAFSTEAGKAFWEQRLSSGTAETFVALVDDGVVGWSSLGSPHDSDLDPVSIKELYGLYVLPRFWGCALGYRLHAAAELRMRQHGARTAVLWVLEENRRARKFYERQGYYRETGRAKALDCDGVRAFAVRYRKALETI